MVDISIESNLSPSLFTSWFKFSSFDSDRFDDEVTSIVLVCSVPFEPTLVWVKFEVWLVKSGLQFPKVSLVIEVGISSPSESEEQLTNIIEKILKKVEEFASYYHAFYKFSKI